MIPDYTALNFSVRGQTMITTFTGKGDEKEEIYLIGGLGKPIHYRGFREISKLGKTGLFETISTKLKHGRAYHIALPISFELAKESCLGHYEWSKKNEISDRRAEE